ncbi:hypothetical protein HPB49_019266 [Dermacentor silvarum]|uniref:Uncharacterized protein n=1 Tax=Dermacentor silvarum TaxID=543639 RepID=A0ACB8CSR9_DERSI|nr:hypothetical protein HPB49_019266 [Dermacentor silvarum]
MFADTLKIARRATEFLLVFPVSPIQSEHIAWPHSAVVCGVCGGACCIAYAQDPGPGFVPSASPAVSCHAMHSTFPHIGLRDHRTLRASVKDASFDLKTEHRVICPRTFYGTLFFDHVNAVDAEAAEAAPDAAAMALVPGDDPDSMREMELSSAETPVYDKTTEYTIQKKLEQWERATSRRASCEQQRSPSHGGGSDGDDTASALGKQAQSKRWKPQVMPRFGAEEAVIIIKPKGTLNLAQFRGSNQIGEAMYAAASIPRASQALAIWPAWDQNIIINGIKNAQLIRQVVAIGQLELGGQTRAVQAYLKTSDNTSRCVIQVDPKATEADITQAINSPEAPVVGVRKLGKTNVAAITFEGRKVPFNVYYWGEAVLVRLYRKTTPACPRCGTIRHRPDVCPNPQTGRCRACGETNLQEDHKCQPSCLICGGPQLTGSIQCNQKYRRGGAGTGAGRKPVNGKANQQPQSKNSVTSP